MECIGRKGGSMSAKLPETSMSGQLRSLSGQLRKFFKRNGDTSRMFCTKILKFLTFVPD